MLTPASLRAMRGALDWSMRDLATAAGVALGTVLKAEQAGGLSATTERRIRRAFSARGVNLRWSDKQAVITIGAEPSAVKAGVAPELLGIPHLSVRPRNDGTYRVIFEVPARNRPSGWPASRPLPFSSPRRGDLTNPEEMKAIARDAKKLNADLHRMRGLHLPS